MAREEITIGGCAKCSSDKLVCKYNRFESDELRIDSWEHKCPDCGHRETQAIRSDDDDEDEEAVASDAALGPVDPLICPYCGRTAGV